MHPVITIFCPFSRSWAVERWLSHLEAMPHDPTLTNLAVIIDVEDPYMLDRIRRFATRRGYRSFFFKMNNFSPNEVKITARRLRIADVKDQSKDLIAQCDGDIVLSLEDDTVFPTLDINRLINPLLDNPKVGFVEGVQCGRWELKIIGAWRSDNPLDPNHIETLLPGADDYESIDGGGWYGYATRKDLYLNCDYYASRSQPWGPDVNYGLWLKRMGYECLIDWKTIFGHDNYNKILYPDGKLVKSAYHKDRSTGRWDRRDEQQAY